MAACSCTAAAWTAARRGDEDPGQPIDGHPRPRCVGWPEGLRLRPHVLDRAASAARRPLQGRRLLWRRRLHAGSAGSSDSTWGSSAPCPPARPGARPATRQATWGASWPTGAPPWPGTSPPSPPSSGTTRIGFGPSGLNRPVADCLRVAITGPSVLLDLLQVAALLPASLADRCSEQ
jgi:hypothetical protein